MPASKFVIRYSAGTGAVRGWSTFPEANETDAMATARASQVGTGEAAMLVDVSEYGDLAALQAIVTAATGLDPEGKGTAELDGDDNVVAVLTADPDCGDGPGVPGRSLIKLKDHGNGKDVRIGWTWNGHAFVPPQANGGNGNGPP